MKNIRIFYLKMCHFLVVKFSVYLNRRVFVMTDNDKLQLLTCTKKEELQQRNHFGTVSKKYLSGAVVGLWPGPLWPGPLLCFMS